MLIIGITGPSGAGKGAVSEYLNTKYNFPVIDADRVYHDIISTPSDCVRELTEQFGTSVLNEDGGIDRKALSRLVFGEENRSKLLLLNKITHKYVIAEIGGLIEKYASEGADATVIDAPLLIEAKVNEICDYVIAVLADKDVRAERIAMRDGIDKESALLRINSQKPDGFYKDSSHCVLQNDFDLKALKDSVDQFLQHRSIIK